MTITGIDDGMLIANGSMRGERIDDAHGRNGPFLATPIAVWDRVLINLHFDPGAAIGVGTGDVAGALAWDLGDLAPSETSEFTVFKLAMLLTEVPRPASQTLISMRTSPDARRRPVRERVSSRTGRFSERRSDFRRSTGTALFSSTGASAFSFVVCDVAASLRKAGE